MPPPILLRCTITMASNNKTVLEGCNDARTGIPPGIPEGAMCVQRFDDSLNSAIHITYRNSLRSSSMREPRDPLLKVVSFFCKNQHNYSTLKRFYKSRQGNFHSLDLECTGDM